MKNECVHSWPEEPTPSQSVDCSQCGLNQHGSRMIWGEGNPSAPIMVILDNPGMREDRMGNPFVCGTRETLQQAAYEVGLKITDIYVTYILKRKPTRTYNKEQVRNICMHHLFDQLNEKKPRLIFCLGNVAVQSFFQDQQAEVKNLRGRLHTVQTYKTLVGYHPLAVRRRPNLRRLFLEDWSLVAQLYKQSR